MITTADIAEAARRIEPHVCRTPLLRSAPMSERIGATIAIKAEHRQHTGSFKLRGALNKVLGLGETERAAGIITASSGNHGIATALAANIADVACTVYLPAGASPAKVAAIGRLGATIVTVDDADAHQAEIEARSAATGQGRVYISPYNDAAIMAGQGTVGREIDAQAADAFDGTGPDAVVVAVGGGGLISGVATWLAAERPDTLVIGASPA
ncbi:MAG: pyridoxal-phosphate dependent enzyme, partial [Actinomycetota bacterium]